MLMDLRFSNGDAAICSGVLVTPRVLITAAHCLDPSLHASTSMTVKATTKPDDTNLKASDFIAATVMTRHPLFNAAEVPSPYDIGMVLLASAPAASPMGLQRALPANFVGKSIRAVGYGRTSASATDSGTRRTTKVSVTSMAAKIYNFGVAGSVGTCSGDSGGPSFYTESDGVERVTGIHSTAESQCGAGDDVRIDTALSFIDGFITANDAPLCTADGRCATGCPTADPDCPTDCVANGVCALGCPTADPDCCATDGRCDTTCYGTAVDPDCRCRADNRCDTGCTPTDPDCLCVADGTCETTCPTGTTDPDCGCQADAVCVATCASDPDCANCGSDGVCATTTCPTRDPDCLLDGDVCDTAAQCVGHQCLLDRRGFKFCSRGCTDTTQCQLDFVCTDSLCTEAPLPPLEPVHGSCSVSPGLVWPFAALALLLRFRRQRV